MFINDFSTRPILAEGINDKYIFKAIFVSGPPGAGKNTIIKYLGLDNIGLKVVDSDETLARLRRLKKIIDNDYAAAHRYNMSQQQMWTNNYLGLIINTTGRFSNVTIDVDKEFELVGYDRMMLFVDVEKENALARITKRPHVSKSIGDANRHVDLDYFDEVYDQMKENIDAYHKHFADNFCLVTNNDDLIMEDSSLLKNTIVEARKKINAFLNRPITSHASEIIQSKLKK